MSVQDVLDLLAAHALWVQAYFALPPLLAAVLSLRAPRSQVAPGAWGMCASALIYLVAIPGTVAAVLVGYSLFFIRANLLEVNALIYFLPIASMLLTFVVIGRSVKFATLPGFGRLSGLMLLIALSFAVVLALYKLRIVVGFFGSFEMLIVLGVLVFAAFQYASRKLMG